MPQEPLMSTWIFCVFAVASMNHHKNLDSDQGTNTSVNSVSHLILATLGLKLYVHVYV